MADNYLERKFEEHYASKSSPRKKRQITAKSYLKPGEIIFKFPARNVIVIGKSSDACSAAVDAFRKANCKVAFCAPSGSESNLMAQASGARFYPIENIDMESLSKVTDNIIERWKQLDIVVLCDSTGKISAVESSIDFFLNRCSNHKDLRIELLCDSRLDAHAIAAKYNSIHLNCVILKSDSVEQNHPHIGSLLLYLASPYADIISGQIISV